MGFFPRHVDDNEILRVGGAQVAASIAIGQACCSPHLFGSDSSAQDRCAHVKQPGLFLRMYAHMIAEDVRGDLLGSSGCKPEAQALLNILQEALGRPAVTQEEILEARPLP